MVVSVQNPLKENADKVEVQRLEAFSILYNLTWDWKPVSDVFTLRFGPILAGGMAGISGWMVNHHFRRWLRLGRLGRFTSYAPMTVIPAFCGAITHGLGVTQSVMTDPKPCSVCLELRSIGIQVGMGVVYPLILGPFAAMRMASGYQTYPVPRFTEDFPEVRRLFLKFLQLGKLKFLTLLAASVALGIVLPAKETRDFQRWSVMLERLEAEFDRRVAEGLVKDPKLEGSFLRNTRVYPPPGSGKPLF